MVDSAELAKYNASRAAIAYIKRGMTVGLGTGSTAAIFIDLLAARERREHLGLICIATSKASEERARRGGLHIIGFAEAKNIDVAVDGADIVSSTLCLLKGLGGALLREKCVAYRAKKFIVMVGEEKMRKQLEGIVPIEVIPFAVPAVLHELCAISKKVCLRRDSAGRHYMTDNGNHIIDATMTIRNPEKTERVLNSLPGVVGNGIFTRADVVLVGSAAGCRTLKNKKKFKPLLLA